MVETTPRDPPVGMEPASFSTPALRRSPHFAWRSCLYGRFAVALALGDAAILFGTDRELLPVQVLLQFEILRRANLICVSEFLEALTLGDNSCDRQVSATDERRGLGTI